MTNSGVGFDSAMGYKSNPQLVQNQAADFSFAPNLPQRLKNRLQFASDKSVTCDKKPDRWMLDKSIHQPEMPKW
jgi:hypothetical protein